MLTLKSPFTEYIDLLNKNGACIGDGSGVPWCNGVLTNNKEATVQDALNAVAKDKTVLGAWTVWAIQTFGKELEPDVRLQYMQNTRLDSKDAMHLLSGCNFLSDEETIFLRGLFNSEDLKKFTVCREALNKHEALRSKHLVQIEAADNRDKAKDELESDRTKSTLEMYAVVKEQGFVDDKGDGSVAVFETWCRNY